MSLSSGQDALLTDLCGICHTNPIKYTCPRCGLHTCSLPCVKRHKLWAQCSGVRNPAAFKKRADLATPSSVDQDYNFITNVERSLQRADDDALGRGIDLVPAGLSMRSIGGRSQFELEAEKQGIVVIRAPKGLSRSKQNKSQWNSKDDCLYWTIEWRLPDDRKVFATMRSKNAVVEAYRIAAGGRATKEAFRKRKREESGETSSKQDKESKEVIRGVDNERQGSFSAAIPDLHFYLHRPNTPSKYKCLIPISQVGTINDALQNKTLLEFPTIYVLREGPGSLEAPHITESEYLQKYGEDIPVNLPSYGGEEPEEGEIPTLPDHIDDKKVLEVLRKDISG